MIKNDLRSLENQSKRGESKKIQINRFFLTTMVVLILVFGSSASVVNAVVVRMYTVTGSQEFQRASNGNFYAFAMSEQNTIFPELKLAHSNDMYYKTVDYSAVGWSKSEGTLPGPANRTIDWNTGAVTQKGWLDRGITFPSFWIFENQTNDLNVLLNWKIKKFPLAVGKSATVVFGPDRFAFGLLNVTTPAEYYHLIIQSHQDNLELSYGILGPSGRWQIIDGYMNGGDIQVVPIQYDGTGLYTLFFGIANEQSVLASLTLTINEVTPIELPVDQLAQGVLTGSEWVIDQDTGEVIYQEKVPSAVTYKITSPSHSPGRLSYSFNTPEFLPGTYPSHEPFIFISANLSMYPGFPAMFFDVLDPSGGFWWYQSFNNVSYYVTVIGIDNTEYSLINQIPTIEPLPVNSNFYLESLSEISLNYAFTLHLNTDSLMVINSTESFGGFDWAWYSYIDDTLYYDDIIDASSFASAPVSYLPAGEYLFIATPNAPKANGFYTIHLGPVLEGPGTLPVSDSSVVGARLDAEILNHYAVNVTLLTNNNVSVKTDIRIFTAFGYLQSVNIATLGHIKSGFGWSAIGSNFTTIQCGLNTLNELDEGSFIVALKPYDTFNTTTGVPTNKLPGIPHTFGVDFVDYFAEAFNGTGTIDLISGTDSYSFSLEEPQDPTETYVLRIHASPFKWYNVSIRTADVTSLVIDLYQDYDGRVQLLSWTYLQSMKFGDIPDLGLNFGSVGSDMAMVFTISRDAGVDTGFLNITITEFTTNEIILPQTLSAPPFPSETVPVADWFSQNFLLVGASAGIVIAVAAGVIILKRRKS